MASQDIEAKIVVLGASGVGKTSLLNRYIHNTFVPSALQEPTVGATFLTKRLVSDDAHTPTVIRLQIWDTAGQERFRSISKLYYRGANAAILCYDITDEKSFIDMGTWVEELKQNQPVGEDCMIHVVGTKADVVAEDPKSREVTFERCIQYIAEHLHGAGSGTGVSPRLQTTPPPTGVAKLPAIQSNPTSVTHSPIIDRRNSSFWGFDSCWDSCHEISAKDGDGVEEVFRVITRKLVEQRDQREREMQQRAALKAAGASEDGRVSYFDDAHGDKRSSFRIGMGDKRRSWLSFPSTPLAASTIASNAEGGEPARAGRCC